MEYKIIVIIIFSIIGLVRFIYWLNELNNVAQNSNQSSAKKAILNNTVVSNTKEHLEVEIEDLNYSNFINGESDYFKGYVELIHNVFNNYVIIVKDNLNNEVGIIGKRDFRKIFNVLYYKSNRKMFAWGFRRFINKPTIYLYLNGNELDEFNLDKMLNHVIKRESLIDKGISSIDNYIQVIELQDLVVHYCKLVKLPKEFNPGFTASLITKFSILLENEKQYTLLTWLNQYLYLMDDMHPKYKNTVIRRIEKATKMLKQNNT